MKWIAKKIFDGGGDKYLKKHAKSSGYLHNILKFIQKCGNKLFKFDTILSVAVICVVSFAITKDVYLSKFARVCIEKVSFELNGFLYQNTFDKIAARLVVYDAKMNNIPLEFIRLGRNNDGGYVVPIAALESADALMGYGIADDISFERDFSQRFDKLSFGFDCGVQNIKTDDSRCHFCSECIGTSKYLYKDQTSSGHISSFSEQLQRLKLTNKKVFIKMDIEGAEFDVMDDILKHMGNVTGMVLEIHIPHGNPEKVLKTLSALNRHLVLVHLHGNNYSDSYFDTKYSSEPIPKVLELTYINKNLLSFYEISKNQKHPKPIDQPSCPTLPECEFEIIPGLS